MINKLVVCCTIGLLASCGGEQADTQGNDLPDTVLVAPARMLEVAVPMDSVRVHIEEDPDGDGFYQIQYSYKDRAGVWGVSNAGHMRVMYEVAPDTMVTDWYVVYFNNIADVVEGSVFVDLALFSEFGMSFGSQAVVFQDGTLSWDSPGGQWYYMANPDTVETEL